MASSYPGPLRARLLAGEPVLADGAMGTELQKRGLPLGLASAGFTLEHPDRVLEIHQAYRSAGAELMLTNTFGFWPAPWIAEISARACTDGISPDEPPYQDTPPLIAAAVALARQAAGRDGFVAGCVAPPPPAPAQDLRRSAAQLARWFEREGADALWIESQLSLETAIHLVEGAVTATTLPLLVSFSFHGPGGTTQAGETPAEVARALARPELRQRISALGANCGAEPEALEPILRAMAAAAPGLPLIARPGAGLPCQHPDGLLYPTTPARMRELARAWLPLGVRIVGGCCGTTPEHIRALAELLERS